jgi:CTP:molybdopterin cytidylyltransferase MocA/xanthine/CO dehydrogenase XdhC/CoxF family maturation factor
MQRATLEAIRTAQRERRVLVRALDTESGKESLIDPVQDVSPLGLAAAAAVKDDVSRSVTLDGRQWFLTVYNVPWEIVIIGAVHIAQALAAMAPPAGFSVRIIDPRTAYATEERFPGVRLVHAWPDEALAAEPLTARSALVALSHDPKLDDMALAAALRSTAGYIGALGSTHTHARRLARLATKGFSVDGELTKIRGPVGLAIGARAPTEIAIAILAQLVQLRRCAKPVPRIGGVVLAAGLSARMRRNKLVAPVKSKPLLRHAVEAALAGHLDPVIVVTGHDAAAIRAALADTSATFVHNVDFAKGLSTSLRAGIRALPAHCDGALVLLGDMPDISPALIGGIVAAFDPDAGRALCVATAKGRRGHPVLLGRQFFAEIEALDGDSGARSLMAKNPDRVFEVEADNDAPLIDIDTQEALDAYST